MWTRSSLICLAVPVLLLACAPNDDPTGAGETGDNGVPTPRDPFGGEGSDPPGDPDPDAAWPPPSSLGNGLVHDTRYDLAAGKFKGQYTAQALAEGVD